jgi:hypothetical protein
LRNFLNPYQNVDYAESKHRPLEVGITDDRLKCGETVEKDVVVPDAHPREEKEEQTYFQAVKDVEDLPDPGHTDPVPQGMTLLEGWITAPR